MTLTLLRLVMIKSGVNDSTGEQNKISSRKVREVCSKIKDEPNKQYVKRKVQTNVKRSRQKRG